MRILLINPTTRNYGKGITVQADAPLGLLSIAALLRDDGHTIKIFDRNVESDGITEFLKFQPDWVGVTSFTGPNILDALRLSEKFRSQLGVPIVWGGIHASLLPVQTVSDPRIDMCVVGEGEETIVELADAIENGRDLSNVRGVVWKKVNGDSSKIIQNEPRPFIKNLDALPFPAWDLIDEKKYRATSLGWNKSSVEFFSIQSSRGCPYQCGFCYNIVFNERRWRFKSANRVVEEITFLKDTYNVERINFRDDNFAVSQKRAERICKLIYKNQLDINFAIDCRVDLLSGALAKYLKLGGCDQIFFGIESGSTRILQFIKKGASLGQALRAIRLCKKFKIKSSASFVMGFPTETMSDLLLTRSFIFGLNPDSLLLKIFVPFPGSPLYQYVVEHGLFTPPTKLEDWGISWTTGTYKISEIEPEILNRFFKRIYLSFYTRKLPGMALSMLKSSLKDGSALPRKIYQGIRIISQR